MTLGGLEAGGAAGVRALLFDMNGTLRQRHEDAATRALALEHLRLLLGRESLSPAFLAELEIRSAAHQHWAKENQIQLSEAQIWTQWMLPEEDAGYIAGCAAELMLTWGRRKGFHLPIPGAEDALRTLRRRGYRLGLISNSMSSLDIPRSLEEYGWGDLFETVILSVQVLARKPSLAPYAAAQRALGVAAAACAYIGNRAEKDIPGARAAGFGLTVLFDRRQPPAPPPQPDCQPDRTVHSFDELLALFPPPAASG